MNNNDAPIQRQADKVQRSNIVTIVAVAVLAYTLADMVHEFLGHTSVAWLTGVGHLRLSTVALEGDRSSKLLKAAGCIANVLAGAFSFGWLRRPKLSAWSSYFFWLFASVNLMNGTGYLFSSAVLASGDWFAVIWDLEPLWAWRLAMGLAGAALYALSLRWSIQEMIRMVASGRIRRGELWRLTFPAYLTGGIIMTLAAVFNPISKSLILGSGVSASFGMTWGLLLVKDRVEANTHKPEGMVEPLPFKTGVAIAAASAAVVFVAVLGPGVRLP